MFQLWRLRPYSRTGKKNVCLKALKKHVKSFIRPKLYSVCQDMPFQVTYLFDAQLHMEQLELSQNTCGSGTTVILFSPPHSSAFPWPLCPAAPLHGAAVADVGTVDLGQWNDVEQVLQDA